MVGGFAWGFAWGFAPPFAPGLGGGFTPRFIGTKASGLRSRNCFKRSVGIPQRRAAIETGSGKVPGSEVFHEVVSIRIYIPWSAQSIRRTVGLVSQSLVYI
jgi:hypothetical protein